MAVFPSLTPTSRSFEPGVYPQRSFRTLSGAVVRRTFGSSPFGARLEMEFANISNVNAFEILSHYRTQTSQNKRFKIDTNKAANPLAGINNADLVFIASGNADTLRWEYAEAPKVRSVFPGRSTVTVSLTGEIINKGVDDE